MNSKNYLWALLFCVACTQAQDDMDNSYLETDDGIAILDDNNNFYFEADEIDNNNITPTAYNNDSDYDYDSLEVEAYDYNSDDADEYVEYEEYEGMDLE